MKIEQCINDKDIKEYNIVINDLDKSEYFLFNKAKYRVLKGHDILDFTVLDVQFEADFNEKLLKNYFLFDVGNFYKNKKTKILSIRGGEFSPKNSFDFDTHYPKRTVGMVYNNFKGTTAQIYILDKNSGSKNYVNEIWNTYRGHSVFDYHVIQFQEENFVLEGRRTITLTINGNEFSEKNTDRIDNSSYSLDTEYASYLDLRDNKNKGFVSDELMKTLIEIDKYYEKVGFGIEFFDKTNSKLPIKVYFNDNKKATTLMMNGNKVIVVKCGKGDKYNRRIGFLEAFYQANCGLSKSKALKYLEEIVKEKEK